MHMLYMINYTTNHVESHFSLGRKSTIFIQLHHDQHYTFWVLVI